MPYLVSEEPDKADRVETLLQQPATISVQVLNEDERVSKNCTPSYLPEFIRIEVAKRA